MRESILMNCFTECEWKDEAVDKDGDKCFITFSVVTVPYEMKADYKYMLLRNHPEDLCPTIRSVDPNDIIYVLAGEIERLQEEARKLRNT